MVRLDSPSPHGSTGPINTAQAPSAALRRPAERQAGQREPLGSRRQRRPDELPVALGEQGAGAAVFGEGSGIPSIHQTRHSIHRIPSITIFHFICHGLMFLICACVLVFFH